MNKLQASEFKWHKNQADVPGITADKMKEFFDAPIEKLMEKINEIIGEGENPCDLSNLTERMATLEIEVGVGVTQTDSGYKITITDAKETKEFHIYHGTNGNDGVGITNATINESKELVLTFSDGTQTNLGVVVGTDGKDGTDGTDGADGSDYILTPADKQEIANLIGSVNGIKLIAYGSYHIKTFSSGIYRCDDWAELIYPKSYMVGEDEDLVSIIDDTYEINNGDIIIMSQMAGNATENPYNVVHFIKADGTIESLIPKTVITIDGTCEVGYNLVQISNNNINKLEEWEGDINSLPLGLSYFLHDGTITYPYNGPWDYDSYDVKSGSIITVGLIPYEYGNSMFKTAHITEPDGTTVHIVPLMYAGDFYYKVEKNGNDYTLTNADKQEIADLVDVEIIKVPETDTVDINALSPGIYRFNTYGEINHLKNFPYDDSGDIYEPGYALYEVNGGDIFIVSQMSGEVFGEEQTYNVVHFIKKDGTMESLVPRKVYTYIGDYEVGYDIVQVSNNKGSIDDEPQVPSTNEFVDWNGNIEDLPLGVSCVGGDLPSYIQFPSYEEQGSRIYAVAPGTVITVGNKIDALTAVEGRVVHLTLLNGDVIHFLPIMVEETLYYILAEERPEVWTFVLEDGTTTTKKVMVME